MMLVPHRRTTPLAKPLGKPLDRGLRARIAIVASVASTFLPVRTEAQHPAMGEGALDLLLPTGARAVALGQAAMAVDGTTESVWWNPSALARMKGTSAAIHHSQSIGGKADALSVVAHSRLLGSFGVSASLRDFGSSGNADESGAEGGTILPRSLIYAATYAAALERLNVGLSYKLVQWRIDCTGPCTGETGIMASTSAVDAGAQFSLDPQIPITLGASVDGLRVVTSGLAASDVIVINGLQHVKPGIAVTPQKVAMDADRAGLAQVVAKPDETKTVLASGTAPGVRSQR